MKSYFDKGVRYLSMVKFAHTVFAMPFALIGLFLAIEFTDSAFSWRLLLLIVFAMIFARNSAMGFNRWADRKIDARNPRTSKREIPAALLTPSAVLAFVVVNVVLFVIVSALINRLALYLSVPAIIILLGYSYLKRFTSLCHYGLGLALSCAPAAAYISITGRLDFVPLVLSIIVFLWSSSFDILYSLADEEFDRSEGLHSIPRLLGRKNALIVSAVGHSMVIPLLWLFGELAGLGSIYLAGALIFAVLLVYQHVIVKPNDISRLNAAFFTANGVASVIFAVFTIADILI
ncbi:MAG: hypothetical protein ACD_77C00217G0003 [uncultured bacterium]|nr:MAG: hypothetical protein ACD_77C00217G0003 [uncultured bacterium]HBY01130.1 4-hydroxybenzoate octaprenyltransferase [Rikenellaceae bacterium]